jgi:beta-aspartyl-peptidase (threonine type)
MGPTIIVHGGAKEIPPEQQAAHREGCHRAAEAGWAVLEGGGSAVDAVEAAIRVLEDDPTFNAGYGAELNADGDPQMDASIMDGATLEVGAVAFLEGVKNPISVARLLLREEEVLITGDGAHRFAAEKGAELCPKEALITEARRKEWEAQRFPPSKANNTVGCVALDKDGHVAAGASTGGLGGNRRGRVGDSPQVGCGFYADDPCGGAALTGDGEAIARVVLAKSAVDLLCGLYFPEEVARKSILKLDQRVQGEGGIILVDREGRIGWAHNSAHMAVAYRTSQDQEVRAYVQKQQEAKEGARYLG